MNFLISTTQMDDLPEARGHGTEITVGRLGVSRPRLKRLMVLYYTSAAGPLCEVWGRARGVDTWPDALAETHLCAGGDGRQLQSQEIGGFCSQTVM